MVVFNDLPIVVFDHLSWGSRSESLSESGKSGSLIGECLGVDVLCPGKVQSPMCPPPIGSLFCGRERSVGMTSDDISKWKMMRVILLFFPSPCSRTTEGLIMFSISIFL